MRFRNIMTVLFTLVFFLTLVSCSVGDGEFYGGEALDSEKLSEIRSLVFAEESVEITDDESEVLTESTEAEDVQTEAKTETYAATETLKETEAESETENEEQTGFNNGETTDITSEAVTDMTEDLVYWTERGGVWHLSAECRYIKNSQVISGTVDEAISAGKERVCSSCGK